MRAKLRTPAVVLMSTLFVSGCGKPTVPPPVVASASNKKGEITQPAVKPGNANDASALLITFHGCADLMLSDPRGRKLGYDASAHQDYEQIPGGIYDIDIIDDDEDDAMPSKQTADSSAPDQDCAKDIYLHVPQPAPGSYNLSIDNGTGSPFHLEITSYGPDTKQNGYFASSRPLGNQRASSYQFQLPSGPGDFEVKTR